MINIKSKLMRKGLVVIVLPLVLEVAFMGLLVYFMSMAGADIERRIESKKVVATATAIVGRVIDAQLIALMYNAQKIPMLDIRFDEDVRLIQDHLRELKKQCATSETRRPMYSEIEKSVEKIIQRLRRAFTGEFEQNIQLHTFIGGSERSERVYSNMTNVFNQIDKLITMEQRMQSQVQAREKLYKIYIRQSIIWGVSINILLIVAVAMYFAKTITGPIAILLANTERLKLRQPLAPPIGGDDELQHLDEVFRATAEDLERVDRQRKHLVSLVKEELSAPLRQVQYTLHNLSQGLLGELTTKAETRFGLAARDTDRVVRLIDDLLSIETMEGTRFELDLQQTSTGELITAAVGSVRDMAERHGIKLEIKDTGAKLVADKDRLVQVLINFLSNAVKFSPKASIITIQVVKDEQSLEFRVIDRGRGVPSNKLDQIFQPFQQVDSSDQTEKGGTGLGLPISKTIVEQHGGRIGVTSEPEQGSTFWFRIPR